MTHITVTATFASSHQDASEGPHRHGHTFHVSASERGNDAGVRDDLHPDLVAILSELHLHDMGDMLVGGSQTLTGIGAWVMERLLLRHPRLTIVEVWTADQPEVRVGVDREIR